MQTLSLKQKPGVQALYTTLHRLLLVSKLAHYKTKNFAGHEALGKTYDSLNDLLDEITEQLVGYSGQDPDTLDIGRVETSTTENVASMIILAGTQVIEFAKANNYANIENLGQELSGIGAKLKYLSRFP